MTTALFIAACAIGFMVRDGWPGWRPFLDKYWPTHPSWLNPTQLARVSGAVICGLGALAVFTPLHALILAGLVLASFYVDQKHGEGQGPDDTWAHSIHNVEFLAFSGVTSMAPLALYAGLTHWDYECSLAVIGCGSAKCVIWPLCWNTVSTSRFGWFFEPTRIAAIIFGAVTGAVAYFV